MRLKMSGGGLTPQSYFGSIHAIHAWFSSGCAARRNDHVSGQETELHQTPGDVFGQFQAIENCPIHLLGVGRGSWG